MSTHTIRLTVTVTMDEMDGSPEQSAEIAQTLVAEAIAESWDAAAEVIVSDYAEVTA